HLTPQGFSILTPGIGLPKEPPPIDLTVLLTGPGIPHTDTLEVCCARCEEFAIRAEGKRRLDGGAQSLESEDAFVSLRHGHRFYRRGRFCRVGLPDPNFAG